MFSKNKKAQIGETLTWVVATIVIIVILGVSIFIVSLHLKNKNFIVNRKSDLIATKSITSFLIQDSNLELIKSSVTSGNYDNLEKKFGPFLESLEVYEGVGNWNIELFVNEEKKFYINPYDPTVFYDRSLKIFPYYLTNFEFRDNNKKIRLKFWEDCQGKCQ